LETAVIIGNKKRKRWNNEAHLLAARQAAAFAFRRPKAARSTAMSINRRSRTQIGPDDLRKIYIETADAIRFVY